MSLQEAIMESVRTWLGERGIPSEFDEEGRLSFEAARGDCLIEVDPAGVIRCQFGIDLEELRDLIAGSATEDLGEDELVRAARYHLQTLARPYADRLGAAQFAEEYEVTPSYAVIAYVHPVDLRRPERVFPVIERSLDILK